MLKPSEILKYAPVETIARLSYTEILFMLTSLDISEELRAEYATRKENFERVYPFLLTEDK